MAYRNALVVDDDPAMLDAIKYALDDIGIAPSLANSREEAIILAKQKPYELCICDGLYGEWILLRDELKSFSPSTRFILLSGDPDQIDIAKEGNIECYIKGKHLALLDSLANE